MFLGHAAVALAVVGLGAFELGWSRERALYLGLVAALVATLPDVDMLYALTGFVGIGPLEPFALAEGFWSASTAVHRSITHSLILAVPVAAGTALVAGDRRRRFAGLAGLAGLVALVGWGARPISVVVLIAFVLGAIGAGLLARRLGFGTVPVFVASAIALLSHPFGDLFTGSPPQLLYPLHVTVFGSRLTLAPDPTMHLLGAFFLEMAAIWLGIYAILTLRDEQIRDHLRPRAILGGAYALAVLVVPPPTLDVSYQFVFSVVSIGFLGVTPSGRTGVSWPTTVVTGVAAVTVAGFAYTVGYLVAAGAPIP